MVMVAGEITTQTKIDYDKVVRGVVSKIGFDSYIDDLSSVDSKGLSDKTCEVLVRINKQSPDIAGGVHVGKEDLDVGAGDQGIMFGYASDETEDCMPLTHSMATRLGKKLTDVRKSGLLWWLRPDGKTQVTIEYLQKADGSVEPRKIHTVVISTQHAEPSKATKVKEVAGYNGPDAIAPSMEEMNKLIVEEVVKKTLQEIKLKNGEPAITLFGDHTHLYINPSGKFIIGGPQGDAGLTGRKIIIDTYGGWGAHGGGAFSERIPQRWTGPQLTFAGRWPNPWLKVACANVLSFSSPTPSEWQNPCHCSLKHMAPSKKLSQRRTLPTLSKWSLIAGQVQSPCLCLCVNPNIKKLRRIAILAGSRIQRMASNSSSGKMRKIVPGIYL
jgi:S-adenosylmethionine synthetase